MFALFHIIYHPSYALKMQLVLNDKRTAGNINASAKECCRAWHIARNATANQLLVNCLHLSVCLGVLFPNICLGLTLNTKFSLCFDLFCAEREVRVKAIKCILARKDVTVTPSYICGH